MQPNPSDATLQQPHSADELRLNIARLEHVLAEVSAIESSYDRRSDLGWLFSIAANEAGTLAAITLKQKTHQWTNVRREIEQHLQRLHAELGLKEHEARHAENVGI